MRRNLGLGVAAAAVIGLVGMARPARAEDKGQPAADQPGGGEADEQEAHGLAKAVQNPVADLISVPFQNNTTYNIGPYDRAQNTLNIQPVVPFHLAEKILLVTRTILPIVYQPDVTSPSGGSSGVGDLNPTFFVAPATQGKFDFGVGPTFLIPTATQRNTGTGKFGLGPAAVVLVQPDPWTLGVLASQIWSVAGPSNRASVSVFTMQYFINYNLAHAWYLTSSPIVSADFKAPGGTAWTVPFGAGVGKIFKIGKLPFNGNAQGFYNVRNNDDTIGGWQVRLQLALLFPTGHKKKPEEKQGSETASTGSSGRAPGG
jgi:hypothetical protein